MQSIDLTTICPFCKYQLDAVSCVEGSPVPEPGDITMCFKCGEICVFDGDPIIVRKPNEKEYDDIGLDPEVQRMRDVWVRQSEARDKGEEPEVESILDRMFRPVVEGMTKRNLNARLIMPFKAAFALGGKAVLHILQHDDQDRTADILAQLDDEIEAFLKLQQAHKRKGGKP